MNAPAPTHRDNVTTPRETLLDAVEKVITDTDLSDHEQLAQIHALVAAEHIAIEAEDL